MFRTALTRRVVPATRRFYSAAAGENAFVRERQAVKEHAGESASLWRKISILHFCAPLPLRQRLSNIRRSVVIPAVIGAGANAYVLWNKHWEHWSHMPPLEERVEYPYQNIRTKNFSWGDGDKTLFWNDKVNYHNKDKQV